MADAPNDSDAEDMPAGGEEGQEGEGAGSAGVFNTMFIVPPKLSEGDYLTPFQFEVNSKKFYFLGRYNAEKDAIEFCLAGSAGSGYKMCISDGNSPYGWKVKRHGVTKTSPAGLEQGMGSYVMDRFMDMVGQSGGGEEGEPAMEENERQKLQEETFESEDIVAVPHAMMRSSSRQGIMDAKYECVKPWSFYGPSLPEYFCRCKVKVIVYGDDDDHAEKIKAAEEGGGGDMAFTEQGIGEEQDDQANPTGEQPEEDLNPDNNPEKYGGESDENTDYNFPPPPSSLGGSTK